MSVDGAAAGERLLAFRTCDPGYCLRYVWQAYKAVGASTGRAAATAYDAWHKSDGQHAGDRNPPAGVPVFFGPKATSAAGDVVISLGGGRVAATDWPRNGVIGSCTIAERERQIGRPYLGWTERIFDVPITLPAATGTSSTIGGFLMSLSDFQQQQMYDALVRGNWYMTDAIVNILRGEVKPLVQETFERVRGNVNDPDYARGDVLQLIREKLGTPIAADVDEASLARELAPLLGAYVSSLSDEEIARVAQAAADEQDRRERARLGG